MSKMAKIIVYTSFLGAIFVMVGCASVQSPASQMGEGAAAHVVEDAGGRLPLTLPDEIRKPLEEAWLCFAEAYSREDAEEIMYAAEKFLAVSAAVHEPSLCAKSHFWITLRQNRVRSILQRHFFTENLNRCYSRYDNATLFSEAIQASQDALALVDEAMALKCWTTMETGLLKELRLEWVERGVDAENAFRANKDGVVSSHLRKQRGFATNHALKDYKGAEELYTRQRRKRFNYKWMGYPRDDVDSLSMARMRLYRITSEPLVDAPVRSRAMLLASTIDRRGVRGSGSVKSVLPSYREFAGFPVLSDKELSQEADVISSEDGPFGKEVILGAIIK